jgi:hypothetical protein
MDARFPLVDQTCDTPRGLALIDSKEENLHMDPTDSQPLIVRTPPPAGAPPPTPDQFRTQLLAARLRHADRAQRYANVTVTPSDAANLAASLRAEVAALTRDTP